LRWSGEILARAAEKANGWINFQWLLVFK
jgi:hypothetical protein